MRPATTKANLAEEPEPSPHSVITLSSVLRIDFARTIAERSLVRSNIITTEVIGEGNAGIGVQPYPHYTHE